LVAVADGRMREGTGVPICRGAERLGVRTQVGMFAGIVAGDHGRAGGSVAPRRGKSCHAGPTGQRAEHARRRRSRWRAGAGPSGGNAGEAGRAAAAGRARGRGWAGACAAWGKKTGPRVWAARGRGRGGTGRLGLGCFAGLGWFQGFYFLVFFLLFYFYF
jgi:hypothetical protein